MARLPYQVRCRQASSSRRNSSPGNLARDEKALEATRDSGSIRYLPKRFVPRSGNLHPAQVFAVNRLQDRSQVRASFL